jgi:O-succinylbenzoate synthase
MRLESIELHHIRMSLREPFETSFGVTREREAVLIRVCGLGGEGWGECVAGQRPDFSYETTSTAWSVLTDFLIPAAFATEVEGPQQLRRALDRVRGHPMAKAGLEAAVWDLFAAQAGQSLAHYLGGKAQRVAVGVSVGIRENTAALLKAVEEYTRLGYARVKTKIRPGRDVEDVRELRKAFPGLALQVDANAAYALADLQVFKALDDFDLAMIEQPLGATELTDHSRLQAQLRTPVCLDESISDVASAGAALDLGACRIVNIKPGRVGGLGEARRIHDMCASRNVPVWCGGMLETGIGRAANVALATLPNFRLPGDLSASDRYYAEDLIEQPFVLNSDSTLSVPTGPGIGVGLRWDRLRKFTLRRALLRA